MQGNILNLEGRMKSEIHYITLGEVLLFKHLA